MSLLPLGSVVKLKKAKMEKINNTENKDPLAKLLNLLKK